MILSESDVIGVFQVLRNIGLQAIICSTRRGDEETAGIENIHSCAIRREGAAYRSDWRNGRPGLIRLSVSKSHDEGRNKQYREFPHSESFGRGNRGRTGPLLGRAYSPCSLPFCHVRHVPLRQLRDILSLQRSLRTFVSSSELYHLLSFILRPYFFHNIPRLPAARHE